MFSYPHAHDVHDRHNDGNVRHDLHNNPPHAHGSNDDLRVLHLVRHNHNHNSHVCNICRNHNACMLSPPSPIIPKTNNATIDQVVQMNRNYPHSYMLSYKHQ